MLENVTKVDKDVSWKLSGNGKSLEKLISFCQIFYYIQVFNALNFWPMVIGEILNYFLLWWIRFCRKDLWNYFNGKFNIIWEEYILAMENLPNQIMSWISCYYAFAN
jgi:hypothetical protein